MARLLVFLAFLLYLATIESKTIRIDFEEKNSGHLISNCLTSKTKSTEIKSIDKLNIPQSTNGQQVYYVSKGHSCFQIHNVLIDKETVLKLEYYATGNGVIQLTAIHDKSKFVESTILDVNVKNKWNLTRKRFNDIKPGVYTVSSHL